MESHNNTSIDPLAGLTRDEREVFARVSRRGFMGATAGATLSALVGREPRLQASQARPTTATADAVIVLWMAGGMAQTETFDPKRYTPDEGRQRGPRRRAHEAPPAHAGEDLAFIARQPGQRVNRCVVIPSQLEPSNDLNRESTLEQLHRLD